MTTFRPQKIPLPDDADHFRRSLIWLKRNLPGLADLEDSEFLFQGRKAVEATQHHGMQNPSHVRSVADE